jgi:hypothetical protein
MKADFSPANRAHPGLRCADCDGLIAQLRAAGIEVKQEASIPDVRRCHVCDPFGNRIEWIGQGIVLAFR